MINLIFLLVIFAVSYASDRPGTPRPSSHRIGVIRIFTPTPPGTPPSSPKTPKTPIVIPTYTRPEWERDCLEDWGGKRKRSTPVRDDEYKRFDLDSSIASTYMSSDDELDTSEGSNSDGERTTNLDTVIKSPGILEKILQALKIR